MTKRWNNHKNGNLKSISAITQHFFITHRCYTRPRVPTGPTRPVAAHWTPVFFSPPPLWSHLALSLLLNAAGPTRIDSSIIESNRMTSFFPSPCDIGGSDGRMEHQEAAVAEEGADGALLTDLVRPC
jgi:hypothetical protein